MRILRWLVPAVILLAAPGCRPSGGHLHNEQASLRGMAAVYLVVENLDTVLERDGLSTEVLIADVTRRLTRAGLRPIANPEWVKTPGNPYLHVNVTATPAARHGHSYAIQVSFRQVVALKRMPEVLVIAKTWERGTVGFAGPGEAARILKEVGEEVEEFIRDVQAAGQ